MRMRMDSGKYNNNWTEKLELLSYIEEDVATSYKTQIITTNKNICLLKSTKVFFLADTEAYPCLLYTSDAADE